MILATETAITRKVLKKSLTRGNKFILSASDPNSITQTGYQNTSHYSLPCDSLGGIKFIPTFLPFTPEKCSPPASKQVNL